MLNTLTPAERVAFVLHDVFGVPFNVIGQLVGRSDQAARKLASRARRQVREAGPSTPDGGLPQQRVIVDASFTAARAGDFDQLMELLDPMASSARTAARPGASLIIRGAAQIVRARIATASSLAHFTPVLVNGVAGMLITVRGRPVSLIAVTSPAAELPRWTALLTWTGWPGWGWRASAPEAPIRRRDGTGPESREERNLIRREREPANRVKVNVVLTQLGGVLLSSDGLPQVHRRDQKSALQRP